MIKNFNNFINDSFFYKYLTITFVDENDEKIDYQLDSVDEKDECKYILRFTGYNEEFYVTYDDCNDIFDMKDKDLYIREQDKNNIKEYIREMK